MTLAFRVASVTMVLALLLGGPLAPLAAAQSAAQQAGRPDVFKESLKTDEPRPEQADVTFNETFYDVLAVPMTGGLVLGRSLLCGLGFGVGVLVMVATFGTGYRAASGVLHEGCAGKWIVRGEDLVPDRVPIVDPVTERK